MNSYVFIIAGMSSSFILCMAMLFFYLKYRKNIMQHQYRIKVVELQHQKELIRSVITSQEEERRRIGMDLHDEIGASLSAIKLMMQLYPNESGAHSVPGQQVQIGEEMDKIINSVRHIAHHLSPAMKGTFGFSDAVQEYCGKIDRASSIDVTCTFECPEAEVCLQGHDALHMYRIITELVNNTIRHAQARAVHISFYFYKGKYVVDYTDDGIGIDMEIWNKGGGMGQKNIESRIGMMNGSLELRPVEKGSFIRIGIPVVNKIV